MLKLSLPICFAFVFLLISIVLCDGVGDGVGVDENTNTNQISIKSHVLTPFFEDPQQSLLEYAELLWNFNRETFWSFLRNPTISYATHFSSSPNTFELAHSLHFSLASLQSHSIPPSPNHPQCSNFATSDGSSFHCSLKEIENLKDSALTFYCGDILSFNEILPSEIDLHSLKFKFISSHEREKLINLEGYDLLMELKDCPLGNWTSMDEEAKSLSSFGLWMINKILRAKNQPSALNRLRTLSSSLPLALKEFKKDNKKITDIVRNLSNAIPPSPSADNLNTDALISINGLMANPAMLSLHSLLELNILMMKAKERVKLMEVFSNESDKFVTLFIRETMPFLFEDRFYLPTLKVSNTLLSHFSPLNLNDLEEDDEYKDWDKHQVSIVTGRKSADADGDDASSAVKQYKIALNLIKLTIFIGPQVSSLPLQLVRGIEKILSELFPLQVSFLFMTPQEKMDGPHWKKLMLMSKNLTKNIPLRHSSKMSPEMLDLLEKVPLLSKNGIAFSVNGDYFPFDSISFYNTIMSLYSKHISIYSFGLLHEDVLIKPDRPPSKVRYMEVREKLALSLLPKYLKGEMKVFNGVLNILRETLLTPFGIPRTSLLVGERTPESITKVFKQMDYIAHVNNENDNQLLSISSILDPILNSITASTLSSSLMTLKNEVHYSILFRQHSSSYEGLAKQSLIPGLKTINQAWGHGINSDAELETCKVAIMPQAPPAWQLISSSDAVDVDNYPLSSKSDPIPFSMRGWILEGRLSSIGDSNGYSEGISRNANDAFYVPGVLLHCSHAPSPTRSIGPLGYFQFPISKDLSSRKDGDEDGSLSISFGIDTKNSNGKQQNRIKNIFIDSTSIQSIVENQCSLKFVHDNSFSPSSLISFSNNDYQPSNDSKGKKKKKDDDEINIFSIASGKDYERLIKIMSRSVMEGTSSSKKRVVNFHFVANDLTPSFGEDMKILCEQWDCHYKPLYYRWPSYLTTKQWRKHRTIWAEKVLFLDIFFPEMNKVSKILYIDADQVMRVDPKQYFEYPLDGNVFGMVPFCSGSILARKETKEFRFWEDKNSYWGKLLNGRPYFISALFVVDMIEWYRDMAGEILRSQYSALSRNPSSLNQLDQDLPNMLQDILPIRELPSNWLWCESWCTDASKDNASSIDLCGNPLRNGESKLDEGARIIPEWSLYDREITRILSKKHLESSSAAAELERGDL